MLRVKTFGDQDSARILIAELAARAVEDVLYVLDSATGPEGADNIDPPPSPEIAKAYKEFRDWFGPQVGASIQSLVVGPLLARLSVDEDGRAYVDDQQVTSYAPGIDRLACRVNWLIDETPSLIEAYSQLSLEESDTAMGIVSTMSSLDLDDVDDRAMALEMLPELERWFMYSNPGAKILRGDKEAIKDLLDSTNVLREKLAVYELSRDKALDGFASGAGDLDVEELTRELHRVEAQIIKHEDKLTKLEKRQAGLVETIGGV